MNRKSFDRIASLMGLLLAVILVATGALLGWGHSFASSNVTSQLAEQKIMFPAAGSPGLNALPAPDKAAMEQYAGQQLTTGAQAKVFADHYIGVHVKGIAGGKTYEEVSGEWIAANAAAQANPKDAALAAKAGMLAGQRTTLFMGETLRGLLGNAYAFWQLGQIAQVASYVSYAGAALFLILALMGFAHLRRVDEGAKI